MVVVLNCAYINNIFSNNIENLIKVLKDILIKYQNFTDLFSQLTLFDIMDWRASQPINNFVSQDLQWSSRSNVGFCGDWFYSDSCTGIESAMNSAIRFAKIIN